MGAKLVQLNGEAADAEYPINGRNVVVGRAGDVVIPVQTVSSKQVRIVTDADGHSQVVNLVENDQVRSTLLNGVRMENDEQALIGNGDVLTLNVDTALRFVVEETRELAKRATDSASASKAEIVDTPVGSQVKSRLLVREVAEDAARLRQRLTAIEKVMQALGQGGGPEELMQHVFEMIEKAERGCIILEHDGKLEVRHAQNREEESDDDSFDISQSTVRDAMEKQQALLIGPGVAATASMAKAGIQSACVAPLIDSQGKSIGVLYLDTRKPGDEFDNEDLAALAAVAVPAGTTIDNRKFAEAAEKRRLLDAQAREVQRALMAKPPESIGEINTAVLWDPADEVGGGDFYSYYQLPDGRQVVYVADTMGHGIQAVIRMAQLSEVIDYRLAGASNLPQAMAQINDRTEAISDRTGPLPCVMTVMNPAQPGQIGIMNAGHPYPYRRAPDGTVTEHKKNEMCIGVVDGYEFDFDSLDLEPGEIVVIATDGISEAVNSDGLQYQKTGRIEKIISDEGGTLSLDALAQRIREDVRDFTGTDEQADDMTIMVYKREPEEAKPPVSE